MDDLLARFGDKLPLIVFALIVVGIIYNKRRDRKRGGGGSRRSNNFRRPNTVHVNWSKPVAPPRFRTGDNNICGQRSNGTIVAALGDLNTADGRPGSDTVFYTMPHVGGPITKLRTTTGKVNSVYCERERILALRSDKGSNWEGTQNVRFYDVTKDRVLSPPLNQMPGANRLDVFPTLARHGYANEWADKRSLIFTVNANKEKFDDYVAGIDVYVGATDAITNVKGYRKAGKLLDKNGNMVVGKRNSHMNYIQVAWDNRFATYILWVSDFFEKTFECWYWDWPGAGSDITRGWHRFYRAPPGNGGSWQKTYNALGLGKSKLHGWQGDSYWLGFWGHNPIRCPKHGDMIAAGGWTERFDIGIYVPGGVK